MQWRSTMTPPAYTVSNPCALSFRKRCMAPTACLDQYDHKPPGVDSSLRQPSPFSQLTKHEFHWGDRQPCLKKRGYMLLPQYRLGWHPTNREGRDRSESRAFGLHPAQRHSMYSMHMSYGTSKARVMTVSVTLLCDMSERGRRDDAEDVAHAESHPEPRKRLAAAVQLLAEGEGMILYQ